MAKLTRWSESVGIGLPALMSQTKFMIGHSKSIKNNYIVLDLIVWG